MKLVEKWEYMTFVYNSASATDCIICTIFSQYDGFCLYSYSTFGILNHLVLSQNQVNPEPFKHAQMRSEDPHHRERVGVGESVNVKSIRRNEHFIFTRYIKLKLTCFIKGDLLLIYTTKCNTDVTMYENMGVQMM